MSEQIGHVSSNIQSIGSESDRVTPDFGRADLILSGIGLTWEMLDGKDVLDVGSGSSALMQVAAHSDSTATITSIDSEMQEKWIEFPWKNKHSAIQADADHLPFKEDSFDYVIMNCSAGFTSMPESIRVLRPGGELRITPFASVPMESLNIFYYLYEVKGMDKQEAANLVESFDQQIAQSHGESTPIEHAELLRESLDNLTQEQKLGVIGVMAERVSEALGVEFSCEVLDPEAHEPKARLIYRKPKD